ncbi:MAG: hypothetical protein A3G81_26130 [Betaproteobacteria bacterium RIFCSPLOWO2_12_FULL_65_14]|nr:MAG: hypothetical protein A3G81_26130 [Betaproteobacteria bacterium RIFCSPLOWO2_12_FULL_65_14]
MRERILQADLSDAQSLLWRVADALRSGRMPAAEDAEAHARALNAILDGDDPRRALGLAGRKGQGRRERTSAEVDSIELQPTMQVELLRREGISREEAVERVADSAHIPLDTLTRYHKKHRKAALFIIDSMVRAVLRAEAKRRQ